MNKRFFQSPRLGLNFCIQSKAGLNNQKNITIIVSNSQSPKIKVIKNLKQGEKEVKQKK